MKKKFNIFPVMLAIIMLLSVGASAAWSWRQQKLNEAANIGRELGLSEDDPFIQRAKELYNADANGTWSSALTWSNRYGSIKTNGNGNTTTWNGYTYYRDSSSSNWYRYGPTGNRIYDYNGVRAPETTTRNGYTYFRDYGTTSWYRYDGNGNRVYDYDTYSGNTRNWNGYTYYQDAGSNWYRYDNRGNKVYDYRDNASYAPETTTRNGYTYFRDSGTSSWYRYDGNSNRVYDYDTYSYDTGTTYSYNYLSGYNWYSGQISPSDSSLDEEAYVLARMAYPYVKNEQSMTRQAACMWTFVNAAGNGNVSNVTGLFLNYSPSNPVTDNYNRSLLTLARDVLFRRQAERNNWTQNGRVLPSDYCYIWQSDTTGKCEFRTTENGANWSFTLRSPYAS
ncbi:hypothetical protein IKE83_02745 [Candidatus Saccharibacteria bacterium]|nr:hypothetical protein [Candidatus Saccharibacteria bacterium]